MGELGRREALIIEGNKSFPTEVIRSALYSQMEFLVAAHPAAPLSNYALTLEDMVRRAYWRQGFADVKVVVLNNSEHQQMQVRIDEGTRYRMGQIRFSGDARAIHDPGVQARLRTALTNRSQPADGDTSSVQLWSQDSYAAFDEDAMPKIKERLLAELTELNFYRPSLNVSVVPTRDSAQGDLLVEMADEGLKGTIDDFGFFYPGDEKKNTDAQLLEYLGLHSGMPLRANLMNTVSNQLWRSGRFLKHQASLVHLPGQGHFRMELDLEDLDEAPPLREPLSTNALVMLKLCDWLNQFPQHPEDMVFSVKADRAGQRVLNADLILSRFGLVFCIKDNNSNRASSLAYALIASSHTFSCYAGWRERKLIARGPGSVTAFVSMVPNPKPKSDSRYNLTIGAGVNSEKSDRPVDLKMYFPPAKFAELACKAGTRYSSKRGKLDALLASMPGQEPVNLQIDEGSGRLIFCGFEVRTNALRLAAEVRSETGAYHRLVSEISKTAAKLPNSFEPAYPKSSFLGFILTDLLQSGVLESFVASNFVANAFSPEQATRFLFNARQIHRALFQLENALGKKDLAGCLKPFEDKLYGLTSTTEAPADPEFYVPIQPTSGQNSLEAFIKWVAALVIEKTDAVWPRNSWPWTLVRETAFTVAGQNPYTSAEMQNLLEAKQTGPLCYWAAAALIARFNLPLAEKFARRSLEVLTLQKLEMDLGIVLDPDKTAGQLFAEALSELGQLTEAEINSFSPLLGSSGTAFLRETAVATRSRTNQAPIEVLHPAIAKAWQNQVRPQITAALNSLLARATNPATPDAAYQRAIFILQTARKPDEFADAARSLELAATNGLASAQLRLGSLYKEGQGVPRNYATAVSWFIKAAEQNEPHAACRVGDMYFEGLGVSEDKTNASAWYEREAQRGCGNAQFRMALCADQISTPMQALHWYRIAATNGIAPAQMTLGERLSDELLTHPDYAEAYLWYRVAAEGGNRVAAVSAQRLKTKLASPLPQALEKEALRIANQTAASKPEQ